MALGPGLPDVGQYLTLDEMAFSVLENTELFVGLWDSSVWKGKRSRRGPKALKDSGGFGPCGR